MVESRGLKACETEQWSETSNWMNCRWRSTYRGGLKVSPVIHSVNLPALAGAGYSRLWVSRHE